MLHLHTGQDMHNQNGGVLTHYKASVNNFYDQEISACCWLPLWLKSHRSFRMEIKILWNFCRRFFQQIWWRWSLLILIKACFQIKNTWSGSLKIPCSKCFDRISFNFRLCLHCTQKRSSHAKVFYREAVLKKFRRGRASFVKVSSTPSTWFSKRFCATLHSEQPSLIVLVLSLLPKNDYVAYNTNQYPAINPLMPSGNKKVTHTSTNLQLSAMYVCMTFLLPPGIKGLNARPMHYYKILALLLLTPNMTLLAVYSSYDLWLNIIKWFFCPPMINLLG